MRRIISVIIQNSSYQNTNREEVNNSEIRQIPDLSIFNLLTVYVLDEEFWIITLIILLTHRLYFEEVETLYGRACWLGKNQHLSGQEC